MTHSKNVLLHLVNVHLAGDSLHQNVPNVSQNGPSGQEDQHCKDEGADGICQLPLQVVLQPTALCRYGGATLLRHI